MGPISLDHAARYPNLDYIAQDHLTLTCCCAARTPTSGWGGDRHRCPGRPRPPVDPAGPGAVLPRPADLGRGPRAGTTSLSAPGSTATSPPCWPVPRPWCWPTTRGRSSSPTTTRSPAGRWPTPRRSTPLSSYAVADWKGLNAGHAARWETFATFPRSATASAMRTRRARAPRPRRRAGSGGIPGAGAHPDGGRTGGALRAQADPPRDETGAHPAAVQQPVWRTSRLRRVRRWVTAGLRRARQVSRP